MSVQEIEAAVLELSAEDFAAFSKWFEEVVATAWDRQYEGDVAAGRLDKLGDEALAEFRAGRTTPL